MLWNCVQPVTGNHIRRFNLERLVAVLREESRKRGVKLVQDDVFALLAAESCTQCCKESNGGNKECPPKVIAE